jgi:maltose O-acetyltransferase
MTPDSDSRSMRERMLTGDLYVADDPELAEHNLRAMDLMDALNATSARDPQKRRRLLTELLGAIGERTQIRPPLRVDYGSHICIGARSFINFGLVALDVAPITIGDDVQIGSNVQLMTPTHPVEPEPRRAKWEAAKPITIATTCGWAAVRSCWRGSRSGTTRLSVPVRWSSVTCRPTWSRWAIPPG